MHQATLATASCAPPLYSPASWPAHSCLCLRCNVLLIISIYVMVLLLRLAKCLLVCCCSSQVKVWQGGELVYPGQECEDLMTTQPPLLVTVSIHS